MIKKASCDKPQSMRYNAEFLMQCLLIRIKGRGVYDLIRETGLLPLPCPSTLQRLLSCTPCAFGLNDFALEAIKKNLKGKQAPHRYGSLVWDEMSIAESVQYNSQKCRFDGFVDYGKGMDVERTSDEKADHALVLIYRPYRAQWIQPIAVYATKGAAPRDILNEIGAKAIVALYKHDAIVKSVVCDGAQPNKKAANLLGISGELQKDSGACDFFFPHPMDDTERIYFFFDPPHLIKCVRNRVFNLKNVQVRILFFFYVPK